MLDKDWVNDAGVERAVNCEIEVALGDFLPHIRKTRISLRQLKVTYGSLSCLAKHFKKPQAVSSIKKYYISMSSDVRFC